MHPIHLCIGAPRAGTTWLFREMRQHPALFVPAVKEVRFWNARNSEADIKNSIKQALPLVESSYDRADQARWLEDWAKVPKMLPVDIVNNPDSMASYLKLMSVKGRPSLDISPAYCFLRTPAIQILRDGLPEGSKVLYLMRDPMDRLLSQVKLHFHLHGMYRGRPSHADLAQFLEIPQQQARWDYAHVVDTWSKIFGDDFIPLPFDDVVNNPKGLTYRVAEALKIDLAPKTGDRDDDDFFHSDQNQNAQFWVTSLGPREKKQMAQAMMPALTRFVDTMPDVATPWLAKLQRTADQEILTRDPVDDIDLPTQKLMRMTESLGDNCEYGFWQRYRAYEPSSLFRWAITPVESLLKFMDARGPLYERENLSVHSAGMVNDSRFGFKFHSRLVEPDGDGGHRLLQDQAAFDEVYQDEVAKIAHLQNKFFDEMWKKPGVYIIKNNKGITEEQARRVLHHLHHHNTTNHLVWVEADGAPALHDIGGGLLHGSLPALAPYMTADAYAEGGWTGLMTLLSQFEPIAAQIARMQR